MIEVETLVVGAGTGGLTAFSRLNKKGHSVLLCDGGPLGTTCARVGCMPSKALVEMSLGQKRKAHSPEFVMSEVRRLRNYYSSSIVERTRNHSNFIPEYVKFLGPNLAMTESGQRIAFQNAVIGVGSSPLVPKTFQGKANVYTSDTIFDLETLTESVDVIGCGPVGLELAQAFSRLGVKTRIFCNENSLNFLGDKDLDRIYLELLMKDLTFHFGDGAEHLPEGNKFKFGNEIYNYETCLLAVGRESNLDSLDLQKISQRTQFNEEDGLKMDGCAVYVVGDASGLNPLVHEAMSQGRRVADLILDRKDPTALESVDFQLIFSDPQVASLKLKSFEGQLEEKLISLEDQGRLTLAGENYGAIKLFFEPENKVIRKAIFVSSQAEHFAHFMHPMIRDEKKMSDLDRATFYHPTIYEAFH